MRQYCKELRAMVKKGTTDEALAAETKVMMEEVQRCSYGFQCILLAASKKTALFDKFIKNLLKIYISNWLSTGQYVISLFTHNNTDIATSHGNDGDVK